MERVDYHLERLLPSVQLLSDLKLFTTQELRSFMHKRRVCETSLISRGVNPAGYLEYIRLEESFERLMLLKLSRSPRDGNSDDVVTLKDRSKLRRFQEKHLISIWQRFITKLGRHDPQIFERYLRWLQQRGMRRVYSEVAAQALSLHASYTHLWIQVADWELNSNMDASAARLTLLRGIRINTVVESDAKRSAVVAKREGRRRRKRQRRMDGDDEEGDESESEGEGDDDTAVAAKQPSQASQPSSSSSPLILPTVVPTPQLQLVDLWLAYLRMELVFLERLRRRWAVLGVNASGKDKNVGQVNAEGEAAERDAQKGNDEDEDDDDEVAARDDSPVTIAKPQSTSNTADDEQTRSEVDKSAPLQILSGALPLRIVSSAMDLPLSASASASVSTSPSLPPRTRFLFLVEALRVVASFPFANHSEEDGLDLRAELVRSIEESVRSSVVSGSTAGAVFGMTRHYAALSLLVAAVDDRNTANRRAKSHAMDPEEATKEQRQRLESASRLVREDHTQTLVGRVGLLLDTNIVGAGAEALAAAEKNQQAQISSPSRAHEVAGTMRAHNFLVRLVSLATERYFELCEGGEDDDDEDAQREDKIQFAHFVKAMLDDEALSSGAHAHAHEAVLKVILALWYRLSWREEELEEGSDSDSDSSSSDDADDSDDDDDEKATRLARVAVDDPLAPYLSAVFHKVCNNAQGQSRVASVLALMFALQTALHSDASRGDGDGDGDGEAWESVRRNVERAQRDFKGDQAVAMIAEVIRRRGL